MYAHTTKSAKAAVTYTAYTDGFRQDFTNLNELRDWANALNARYNLKGKELKIWRNDHTTQRAHTCQPDRTIIFE